MIVLAGAVAAPADAQLPLTRLELGRFGVEAAARDLPLARALLTEASRRDSFPGLPRSGKEVRISIAPDRETFREWIGASVPEWGAAVAFPREGWIVMQGSRAGSDAGDPLIVLRHELAHLALHDHLGDLPPRWFDEGYAAWAAGEWSRDQVIATNLALAVRGVPSLAALDSGFYQGAQRADASYALAHRAVAELAALDPVNGLSRFLSYWKGSGDFESALRRAYGLTTTTFEQRFRSATRRRYGLIALFADATLAALVLVFLIGPFYVIRRRRDRERLRALIAADAEAERRERESMLEQLLRGGGDAPPTAAPPAATPPDASS